jgi:hypothetical protein
MKKQDQKQMEEKPKLPKTPQAPNVEDEGNLIKPDKDHRVPSDKKIDLSDEDKVLDSGI